jgi:hypothetical protein
LRDHHEGDAVTLTVFRDHRLMRHRVVLGAAPADTCYLELDPDADTTAEKERAAWVEPG